MMKKKVLFYLFALFFLLAACTSSPSDRRTTSDTQPTSVPTTAAPVRTTYTVERGEVLFQVEFTGRISPVVEQPLAFVIDGTIKTVYFERGDAVQAGDILADLDTQALEEQLFQAQTVLTIAQNRLETAETDLSTTRRRAEIAVELAQLDLNFATLAAGDAPTPEQAYQISRLTLQLELAQLDLDELNQVVDPVLQADVDTAELQIAELQSLLAQTQLVAPFDGVLSSFNLAVGRTVTAQEPVGVLANPTQLEIAATLFNQNILNSLMEDMTAVIIPADRPGQNYAGFVRQLPFQVSDDTQAVVRIGFEDTADTADFQLNDRVNIIIVVERHPDALWLPPAAIREFNGRHFVVIQEGDFQRRVDVTLGLAGQQQVEIVAGVNEGDIIVGQ